MRSGRANGSGRWSSRLLTRTGSPGSTLHRPAGRNRFPRAHDPILLPSERVRLWFDNSPPGEDPNPSIVRVAFVLEPLEKGRDLAALKQTIVRRLLSEENRQRAERRAVARKA